MAIGHEDRHLTLEELRKSMRYWQDRLRLNHWNIEVRIEPQKVMEDLNGSNTYNTALLESVISLIDPDDYHDEGGYDMEFILVHELLHLIIEVHRHSRTYDERQEIDMEMAINSVARTLMQFETERMTPS